MQTPNLASRMFVAVAFVALVLPTMPTPAQAQSLPDLEPNPVESVLAATAQEPVPVPNLAGSILEPVTTEEATITVTGHVADLEAPAGESRAAVYQVDTSPPTVLHEFVVPEMEPGNSTSFSFEWSPPMGLSHLRLVVDVHNSVYETNEDDNVATTWVSRPTQAGDAPEGGMAAMASAESSSGSSWGSPDTVVLDERPMNIQISTSEQGADIELDDGNAQGQSFWVNAALLQAAGIQRPAFTYDDGSIIPFDNVGSYYHVHAPHFSMIHASDAEATIFSIANSGGAASVYWNNALDRVDIHSAAQDTADKSLVTDFVPHKEFEAAVRFGVDQKGEDQEVYPLALGSRSERFSTNYADYPPNSFGFRYVAPLYWGWDPVRIEAYSQGASGSATTYWTWTTQESPDHALHPDEGWQVDLIIRRVADLVYMELRDVAGELDRSVAVPINELALPSADSIFFGNHGLDREPNVPTQAWSSQFTVTPEKGDLVPKGFEAGLFSMDGSTHSHTDAPTGPTGGQTGLRLTQESPARTNDVGRAWIGGCPAMTAFSVEFQFQIQRSGAGLPSGLAFFFGKNVAYTPANGYFLAFEDSAAGTSGHEGYGIIFDGHQDPQTNDPADGYIALVKDSISNRIATVVEPRVDDQQLHTANIEVAGLRVHVYFDGLLLISANLPSLPTYSCMGFSAAHKTDLQVVDVYGVLVSSLPPNQPPNAPNTPSPPNGANGVSRSPILSWVGGDPQGTIMHYDVRVDTLNPPQAHGNYQCSGAITSTACQVSNLVQGRTYYWRVISNDGVNQVLGTVWSFVTTANQPPNLPSAPQPSNAATNVGVAPTLRWTGGDPDGQYVTYRVYFDSTTPPAAVACWNTYGATSCDVSGLDYDKSYFWRVDATDEAGATTPGPVWTFRTVPATSNHQPKVPSSPSPVSGAGNQPSGVTATWVGGDPDGDTVTYDVYLMLGSTVSSRSSTTLTCSKTVVPSCLFGGLAPKSTYAWQVVSSDGQLTALGPVWTFTTRDNNQAPTAPSAPFPTDGSTDQSVTPTVRWTSVDPDGDRPQFEIYYAAASQANAAQACAPRTYAFECTLPLLKPNTEYKWWVKAFDGAHSTMGPVWTFRTRVNHAPLAPSLPNPSNGATGLPASLTLSWQGGDEDGTSPKYEIYLGTTPNPRSGGAKSCTTTGVALCTLNNLEYSTKYFWQVVSIDEFTSTVGPAWSFETMVSPVNRAPQLLNPSPYNTAPDQARKVWLRWDALDADHDALEYSVYLWGQAVCVRVTSPNCMVSGLEYGWNYVWYVEATDGRTNTTGPEWWFSTLASSPEQAALPPECQVKTDPPEVEINPNQPLMATAPSDPTACLEAATGHEVDPYVPTQPSPSSGSLGWVPYNITLSWMGQNPIGRTYDVLFDLVDPPAHVYCRETPNASCRIYDSLIPDTTYYWQVRPLPDDGIPTKLWGPVWSFKVEPCGGDTCPSPGELYGMAITGGEGLEDVDPWSAVEPTLIDANQELDSATSALASVASGTSQANPKCGKGEGNKACTVLFLHGYAPHGARGEDNHMRSWETLQETYEGAGYSVKRVGYYGGECDVEIDVSNDGPTTGKYAGAYSHKLVLNNKPHGSNGTGCDQQANSNHHGLDDNIYHLAFHFAWFVYNHYSRACHPDMEGGTWIDVVAHSMGGLITRTALYKVSTNDPLWPPYLCIENVVTLAAPHGGGTGACTARASGMATEQIAQFCENSQLLKDLRKNAQNPQGRGGTHWGMIGSVDDGWVSEQSAIDMTALGFMYWYRPPDGGYEEQTSCADIGHDDYYRSSHSGTLKTKCYLIADTGRHDDTWIYDDPTWDVHMLTLELATGAYP